MTGGWAGGFAGFHDLSAGYPGAVDQSAESAGEDENAEGDLDALLNESITATVAPPEGLASAVMIVDELDYIEGDEEDLANNEEVVEDQEEVVDDQEEGEEIEDGEEGE